MSESEDNNAGLGDIDQLAAEEAKQNADKSAAEIEIERLAALPMLEYEQQCKAAAKKLGLRVTKLRALVDNARLLAGLKGAPGGANSQQLPSPFDPMAVARVFVARNYTSADGHQTLKRWRGSWWIWLISYWGEIEREAMENLLYIFTEHACYLNADGVLAPWAPDRKKIGNLTGALGAVCELKDDIEQPCWLDGRGCGTVIAVANGLLEMETRRLHPQLGTRRLHPHTPLFFNNTAVSYDYNPNAPKPVHWPVFLGKIFKQREATDCIHEWYGYVISGLLYLHKIFMIIGPPRSGKGIIGRILKALLGSDNVCSHDFQTMSNDFGKAPLIGKSLGLFSDERDPKQVASVVVTLLTISGEDGVTVNRKNKSHWQGKLGARLMLLANLPPLFSDASTAVISRIVHLETNESWLGREDFDLENKLMTELSGILNEALDGLHRLIVTNKNRFTHVPGNEETIQEMEDLAAPIKPFVRDYCDLGAEYEVERNQLYHSYRTWCPLNGIKQPDIKAVFGRNLKAAFPSIKNKRPWGDGDARPRYYSGIRLKEGTVLTPPQTSAGDRSRPGSPNEGSPAVQSSPRNKGGIALIGKSYFPPKAQNNNRGLVQKPTNLGGNQPVGVPPENMHIPYRATPPLFHKLPGRPGQKNNSKPAKKSPPLSFDDVLQGRASKQGNGAKL
jgi:putative DNA primase/helicase